GWAQGRVVLYGDEPRIDHVDRLPDPVVVVVDVDAQEVDLAAQARFRNQRIDIFRSDAALANRKPPILDEWGEVFADRRHARRIPLDPQAAPALDQELRGVALDPVSTPNSTKVRFVAPMRRKISAMMPSSSFCE